MSETRRALAIRLAKAFGGAIILGVLVGVLAAVQRDRWACVGAGEYTAIASTGAAHGDASQCIEKLCIDRAAATATFTLVDGSQIRTQFVSRSRSTWPRGCPSNLRSTRMEVLELQSKALIAGPRAYRHPVLIRDCPKGPPRVVLRSDGAMGGGVACLGASSCVVFVDARRSGEDLWSDDRLDRSMKGYELYSWQQNGRWRFTLMTGTNRPKTMDEVTRGPEACGSEWVQAMAVGATDLKAALARIPEGSNVTWIGDLGPGTGQDPTEQHLEMPGSRLVNEIQSVCSGQGIALHISR